MSTAKKLKVTDNEISQILLMREMRKNLSKKFEKLEDELRRNENHVIELVECGCEIDCEFNISVNESYKTYPRYKEEQLVKTRKLKDEVQRKVRKKKIKKVG